MTHPDQEWQLSTKRCTVFVRFDWLGVICECAPLIRKWKGQNIHDLIQWMRRTWGPVWERRLK